MKYINTRNQNNPKVATLVSEDAKFKTVMLQIEGEKPFTISLPTFKRWWKPFEEEPGTAIANEIANDFEAEEQKEKELSDEQYAQIGKEIAEQAKEKAKQHRASQHRAPQKKAVATERPIDVAEKLCKTFKGYRLTTAKNNVGMYVDDKKRVVDIWGRSNKVRIYVASDNSKFKTLSKKLYTVEGTGSGKLDVSMYVEQSNIEAVLTHLLKEDK